MKSITRRRFLRSAGVSLALPTLESLSPAAEAKAPAPRRMFAVCNNLGLLPDQFFPTQPGHGYKPSPYLEQLKAYQNDFTVLSGVSHPEVDGGHPADNCFLTAAPHPSSGGFRNTISLDQYIVERIGSQTRFPSLTFGVNTNGGQRSLSWTGSGVLIPCEEKPSAVFKRMFVQGNAAEVKAQLNQLDQGKSILDAVAGQATALERGLPGRDQHRLDQYFTSVRELEVRLQQARAWELKPKPKAPGAAPNDAGTPREYIEKVKLMYDMARMAFESDSTRCVTLMLDSVSSPVIDLPDTTLNEAYHNLSHHGNRPPSLLN